MNSDNLYSNHSNDRQEASQFASNYPVDFTLTNDQYLIVQHFLPKHYSLHEFKQPKRTTHSSAHKIPADQTQNYSKLSNNFDNAQQNEGRSKRPRIKKVIDRYLEQEPLKAQRSKSTWSTEKLPQLDPTLKNCFKILMLLKKHKSSYPFASPVNPRRDGADNYLQIVKQPMDLLTIQKKFKNGQYRNPEQFHLDINKIWKNSYQYNDNFSSIYKLTSEMQNYYKTLLNDPHPGQSKKTKKTKKKDDKQDNEIKKSSISHASNQEPENNQSGKLI